jgi:aldehyde dehydrogenase (NAD+)
MAMGSKDTSSVDAFTLPSDVSETYSTLLKTFATGKTKTLEWRKWQLKQCWWMVSDNEDAILAALKQDLNRHAMESHSTDLLGLRKDIIESISHLEEWTADEIPDAGFLFGTLGKARIRKEPLGVALIIGAWNFPFLLLLSPMIAAITAGCCCLLKPSELAKESQKLLVDLVPRYLDPSAIGIVTGGPTETAALLERRFNHVFFTGSSKVARFITAATAKHLTPTVLELGGQGPAIVTKNANIDLAAKRIAAAKFSNAGQICLTVNHTFVDPDISEEFLTRLAFWNNTFMGGSQDGMARIINERNFDRLTGFLDKSNGVITYGGQTDRKGLFISPTIVEQVDFSGKLPLIWVFG